MTLDAFVPLAPLRLPPPPNASRCGTSAPRMAGGSGGSRRRKRGGRVRRRAPARDPLLDDGGVDTTSISTYVSCGTCANSLMVSPRAFLPDGGPVRLNCNVCGARVEARVEMLEMVCGGTFDARRFMARAARGVGTELPLEALVVREEGEEA